MTFQPQHTPFSSFAPPLSERTAFRRAITAAKRRSESECLRTLLEQASLPEATRIAISDTARELIVRLRKKPSRTGVEVLVQEFALSSEEGVALMCLAEAL